MTMNNNTTTTATADNNTTAAKNIFLVIEMEQTWGNEMYDVIKAFLSKKQAEEYLVELARIKETREGLIEHALMAAGNPRAGSGSCTAKDARHPHESRDGNFYETEEAAERASIIYLVKNSPEYLAVSSEVDGIPCCGVYGIKEIPISG